MCSLPLMYFICCCLSSAAFRHFAIINMHLVHLVSVIYTYPQKRWTFGGVAYIKKKIFNMHTYICTFLVHTHTIDVYNTHRHKKHVKRRYSMGPHMNPTWIAWFQELLNSVAPGSASLATAAAALPAVAVPPAVPAVLGKHRSCCSGRKGKWLVEWNHKYIYIYSMVRWIINVWLVDGDMYQRFTWLVDLS